MLLNIAVLAECTGKGMLTGEVSAYYRFIRFLFRHILDFIVVALIILCRVKYLLRNCLVQIVTYFCLDLIHAVNIHVTYHVVLSELSLNALANELSIREYIVVDGPLGFALGGVEIGPPELDF